MSSLTKDEYLNSLKKELSKLNFVPEDKFDSVLTYFHDVDVIGFDIDFTLLLYNKKHMTHLIYDSLCEFLIKHKNYPEKIRYSENKDFVDAFSCKNIVIDYKRGNALKLRKDKSIIKAYHGKKELTKEEIYSQYENGTFSVFNISIFYNSDFCINIDSFQPQNVALFLICVDLFDKGELNIIKDYEDIIKNIGDGMNFNYKINSFEDFSTFGYYFPEIYKHPELYLYTKYNCEALLDKLRKKGKKLFFATNSNYSYSHYILEKVLGENYHDYFDLCFYKSCKPGFFQDPKESNPKCYFYNDQQEISCTEMSDDTYKKIYEGNHILTGGSYVLVEHFFQKMLNKNELKCVFVGDNIMGDCEVPSRLKNWESVFIFDDIKLDFIGENPDNYQKSFDDVEDEKDKYDNTLSLYFENKCCLFALPNVEGFKYLFD
jgi:HAD superfamily 5'-nucleotidase-like hydrolase